MKKLISAVTVILLMTASTAMAGDGAFTVNNDVEVIGNSGAVIGTDPLAKRSTGNVFSGRSRTKIKPSESFSIMDANSDGRVTIDEFNREAGVKDGASLFGTLDSDKNGRLTAGEMKSYDHMKRQVNN